MATILAASIVVMALPFESAKASRGGEARTGREGDAEAGGFESDGDDNIGNAAVGGDADSEATGGNDESTDAAE